MSCFRHSEVSAICACKNCNVFLCEKCAISTESGYACSDTCRDKIDEIEKHNQENIKALRDNIAASEAVATELASARKAHRALIGTYILMALMTLGAGIDRGDYSYSVTFILLLLILTVFSFFRLRSIESVLSRLAVYHEKVFKGNS